MDFRSVSILMIVLLGSVLATHAEEDYAALNVVQTLDLDMVAGPAHSAALLSPDGTRVLHIGPSEICLHAPSQVGPWAEIACIESAPETRPRSPEDMFWSPDGTVLLMPTYAEAFMMLRDTDIRLFDPATLAVTNLTDDGASGSLMRAQQALDFDISPRWIDDETIAFLRYAIPVGGISSSRDGPVLMAVSRTGGEPRPLTKTLAKGRDLIYAFAVSADGGQYAYAIDSRNDGRVAGVYVSKPAKEPARRVLAMSELPRPPTGLAFSEDGRYLLLLSPTTDGMGTDARVIDLETETMIDVDAAQTITGAAWSPTGSALAYLTYDRENRDAPGGLFIADSPGSPGRLLIGGAFMPPVCCGLQPFTWATNNTMLLSRIDTGNQEVLYVTLGR